MGKVIERHVVFFSQVVTMATSALFVQIKTSTNTLQTSAACPIFPRLTKTLETRNVCSQDLINWAKFQEQCNLTKASRPKCSTKRTSNRSQIVSATSTNAHQRSEQVQNLARKCACHLLYRGCSMIKYESEKYCNCEKWNKHHRSNLASGDLVYHKKWTRIFWN